jgi:hypothetical protein
VVAPHTPEAPDMNAPDPTDNFFLQIMLQICTRMETSVTRMAGLFDVGFSEVKDKLDTILSTQTTRRQSSGGETINDDTCNVGTGNSTNSLNLYLSSIEERIRQTVSNLSTQIITISRRHSTTQQAVTDLQNNMNVWREGILNELTGIYIGIQNTRTDNNSNLSTITEVMQLNATRIDAVLAESMDMMEDVHQFRVQSEFSSRMLRGIDDDVQYLRECVTATINNTNRSPKQQRQRTMRCEDGGGWPSPDPPGFSETSNTPETNDTADSMDQGDNDEAVNRSTHSMQRRSQRHQVHSASDSMLFDEMSFGEDSSDESYVLEDSSDEHSSDEEEEVENVTNEQSQLNNTVHHSRNLFPGTPNVSAAYWTAPPSWPTPNMTAIAPTPGIPPGTAIQATTSAPNTVRVAVPPTIDMVYSATWEKLEQLRKQIEVAERMQFNVHFAGYLDPSVIKAIERSVQAYYTENGQAVQHEKHIWMRWTNAMFFNIVNGRFHMTVEAKTTKQDFLDEARKVTFTYHEVDTAKEHKYIDDMETALRKTNFMTLG